MRNAAPASSFPAAVTHPNASTIMIRIDIGFLLLATICLITGVSFGILMGLSQDFQLAPVHAHINLVGWASLAIFGLVYRAYPALARSRLSLAHFIVSALGALTFLAGLYVAVVHHVIIGAVAGALLWWLGALMFLVNLWCFAFKRRAPMPKTEAAPLRRAA